MLFTVARPPIIHKTEIPVHMIALYCYYKLIQPVKDLYISISLTAINIVNVTSLFKKG